MHAALPTATPESKLVTRIAEGLTRMGDKAPTKLKSFLRTLKSMLGKESTDADAEAIAQALQNIGYVKLQEEVVAYVK